MTIGAVDEVVDEFDEVFDRLKGFAMGAKCVSFSSRIKFDFSYSKTNLSACVEHLTALKVDIQEWLQKQEYLGT